MHACVRDRTRRYISRVVYDTLLFLHLLGAFVTAVTIGVFCAWGFGAPVQKGGFALADWAWNISGALLIVFGIWLALYVDGYEIWDGWILGALVLFGAAAAFGAQARQGVLEVIGDDEGPPPRSPARALPSELAAHPVDRADPRADGLEAGRVMDCSPRSARTSGTCGCSCTSSARWG